MSFGSNSQKSRTDASSSSAGRSDTFISPTQLPFLQQLFGQAAGLVGQQQGAIGSRANELAGTLGQTGNALLGGVSDLAAGRFGQGIDEGIGGLLGLGGGSLAQLLQQRLTGSAQGGGVLGSIAQGGAPGAGQGGQLAGTDVLQGVAGGLGDFLQQENPGLQPALSSLDASIQNNLQSTLGTIAGQATLHGQTGGDRQALFSGLAGQEAQRQFGQGASSLVSEEFGRRQSLAPQILGQQAQAGGLLQSGDLAARDISDRGILANQQNQLGAVGALNQSQQFGTAGLSELLGIDLSALSGAGSLGLGASQLQAGAGGQGLSALSSLFNLGLAPFGAEFSPLVTAGGIFGSPTVLGRERNQAQSQSRTRSSGGGFSFGLVPGEET